MFLEPVVADLLDVRLRHHPAGPGGGGAIEGYKVRPRLLEPEAYAPRIDHLDLADALLEELYALADDEFVREPVRRLRERLGQARGVNAGRHGLDQRVVQCVEHHERRDDPLGLGRVEPTGSQRDVDGPGHGALGCGSCRAGETEHQEDGHNGRDDTRGRWCHESLQPVSRIDCRDSTISRAQREAQTMVREITALARLLESRSILALIHVREHHEYNLAHHWR